MFVKLSEAIFAIFLGSARGVNLAPNQGGNKVIHAFSWLNSKLGNDGEAAPHPTNFESSSMGTFVSPMSKKILHTSVSWFYIITNKNISHWFGD